MLEHRKTECIGEWRLVMGEEGHHLECEVCGAQYTATPARRKAAVDENLAGTFLRRLANEGSEATADLDDTPPELDDVA